MTKLDRYLKSTDFYNCYYNYLQNLSEIENEKVLQQLHKTYMQIFFVETLKGYHEFEKDNS